MAKIVTPPFRVSFPQVFTPKSFQEGADPKFSVMAVWDPSDFGSAEEAQWAAFLEAIDAASVKKHGKPIADLPASFRRPFRDGKEKEHLGGFEEGMLFATLSTKVRPGVIDRNMQPIIEASDFYAGCYARATVSAYGYDNVSKGVAVGLHNLQKVGEGEPLDGRTKAEDDFGGGDAPEWGSTPATATDDDLLG